METLTHRKNQVIIATALSVAALAGCSSESYLSDPSNVQCDGKRTKVDISDDEVVTFTVHGKSESDEATLEVKSNKEGTSIATTLPEQPQPGEFTTPVPVVDGAELSAFAAGGVWAIDVSEDSVVIKGTCELPRTS